ncbi:MAG TPA: hydrogenase maturation protease [Myxococcales bacterium]|nr:hydrogenase maturation protease [Myxococcales bacterium]
MSQRIPLLVLGMGDATCRDDGVGVAAVARLASRWRAPEGVHLLDGGTLGLALLPWIERADRLLIVDAVRLKDEPPGTLVRLEGPDEVLYSEAGRLSLQQAVDVRIPHELVLLGIVPEDSGPGLELSRGVQIALPALVDLIVAEASRLGFRLAPVPGPAPARAVSSAVR